MLLQSIMNWSVIVIVVWPRSRQGYHSFLARRLSESLYNHRSVIVALTTYVFMGFSGLLVFGRHTKANILWNFEDHLKEE